MGQLCSKQPPSPRQSHAQRPVCPCAQPLLRSAVPPAAGLPAIPGGSDICRNADFLPTHSIFYSVSKDVWLIAFLQPSVILESCAEHVNEGGCVQQADCMALSFPLRNGHNLNPRTEPSLSAWFCTVPCGLSSQAQGNTSDRWLLGHQGEVSACGAGRPLP